MQKRKLTVEDINKVRHIEGFPIAKDEDIIALSDAPYYTACPNPFIEEFIREYGTPYDEATDDYHREPFAGDVSEDKHDVIYNIHGYHTKVPPKAIRKYIEHYTNPDDIVFDGFCGSGMTGVAAQLCTPQRNAIISDLSAYAAFISANYNTPNSENVIYELEQIIDDVESEYGKYYETRHMTNMTGTINYVVWSCVYYCSACSSEFVYYDLIKKYEMKSTQAVFKCDKCGAELERSKLTQKRIQSFDKELNENIETVARVPVLINYSIGTSRYNKKPDNDDLVLLERIDTEEINYFPHQVIAHGDETERLFRAGINHVKQLYPRRVLFFLSKVWEQCVGDNKKLFLITSALAKLTILNRFMPEHGSRALVGPRVGTFYLPPLFVENDVIGQLRFQLRKLRNLYYDVGSVIVSNQSATDLHNIPCNCIDYIFVDPPFGANIMYSELNQVPEAWLRIYTASKDEAIINKTQRKGIQEYQALMTACFRELHRILKPHRWITVEFHNSKNSIWNSIQESLSVSGFVIADVRTLDKEKKTINQFTALGSVDQDLVISAYKPKDSFKREFESNAGREDTAWMFVRQHLENLPVAPVKDGRVEIVAERQAFLLFDRVALPTARDPADISRHTTEVHARM